MSSEQVRARTPDVADDHLDHGGGAGSPGADDAAVRSVDRAAALLVCLADADGSASVTDLSHSLDLHKSTVSRLLSTLERRGLVEQDRESGHFRLGVGIIRLAQSAERTLDLRTIALPEMEALAKTTHETVSLEVFDGVGAAVAICQIDGPNLTPMPDITGRPVAMHAIASGKVLLASLPERTVLAIARRGLIRYTPRTITDPRALLEELATIRKRGYAVAIGEWDERITAAAVPICDARGSVIATVVVWGASARVTPGTLPSLVTAARDAAQLISTKLGWSGGQRRAGIVPHLKDDDADEQEHEVADDEEAAG
ncbi:MAG: IclR family transcriptional regulator [Chloroflexi bacterium]|nr:IclR family transcriptional regulator [Chloroflexota bacterium]